MTKSPLRGRATTLQDAVSATGAGVVIAIPSSFKKHTVILKGSAGIASGAVQIEASDAHDYAGTWGQVGGGPVTVAASTEYVISFEGLFPFLRVRVSTTFVGGTVTATYVGG